MTDVACMIQGCLGKVYAPAGTQYACKEHFLNYLTWRRRKGSHMFATYAGMTMDQRDAIVAEWQQTVRIVETPATGAPKP
jgi:hypothetical protein